MEKLQPQVWLLYALIGVTIVVTLKNVSYFVASPAYQPDLSPKDSDFIKTSRYLPTDELVLKKRSDLANKKLLKLKPESHQQFQEIIFSPGIPQSKILKVLGEPVWKKTGFWPNSIAWSYENVILPDVDIGYIFDAKTNRLRQAEIAFPDKLDLETKQLFLELLLGKQFAPNLRKQLNAVHQGKVDLHNFRLGNLDGVVRRNQKDRIYIGVWEEDFH